MKKPIAISSLFFIFIALIASASSLKTFEITETDKLSLAPQAEDPDSDRLVHVFTSPLDEKGEWQTNYGDAGEYSATVTVSDGVNEVKEEILIIVKRKDESPTIDSFEPQGDVLIEEGQKVIFRIKASDLNNDELSYELSLGGEKIPGQEMLFETNYNDAGNYVVSAKVSDGKLESSKEWKVEVKDVGLDGMMSEIKDVEIAETQTARLDLPDFEKYGLAYEISEPIGKGNSWKTGYDDAGNYEISVKVSGNGFEREEKVNVKVLNKDRPPKLIVSSSISMMENELLNLELKVEDPDNDKASFSAINLPEGAELVDNIIVWKPGYDFVKKEKPEDYVKDAFGLLSRNVEVNVSAKTKNLEDSKTISIKVRDENRPFTLEEINDIEVDEGQEIVFEPKYNDPDNDKVFFRYEGFLDNRRKVTGFGDAGEYVVKMTASDGSYEQVKFFKVNVNDVNRKPEFEQMSDVKVVEGEELRVELNAKDADNDIVSYGAEGIPTGAELDGNVFLWKPGFEIASNGSKDVEVEFIASDGKDETRESITITVLDRNKAPEIKAFSDDIIIVRKEPLLLWVDAVDVDGDELSYEWQFGRFSKIEGSNEHQRIFTTKGMKEVKVIVSDGEESVEKVWNVRVV